MAVFRYLGGGQALCLTKFSVVRTVASRNRLLRIHATKGTMFGGVGPIGPKSASAGKVPRLQAMEIATANFREFFFYELWCIRARGGPEMSYLVSVRTHNLA